MSEGGQKFIDSAPAGRRSVIGNVVHLLMHTKKWWLAPILLAIAILGLLMMLSGSGLAPFIYTLF